jgi:hypothetical protein
MAGLKTVNDIIRNPDFHFRMEQFYKEHGHYYVPYTYAEDQVLSKWYHTVRLYSCKAKSTEKIRVRSYLDEINLYPRDDRWYIRYWEILDLIERNVLTYPVRIIPPKINKGLSEFLSAQSGNLRRGNLTEEKKFLLLKIGVLEVVEKLSPEENWMKYFNILQESFEKYGKIKVPRKISYWCTYQRIDKESLSKKQIRLLNSIGFKWKEDLDHEKRKRFMGNVDAIEKWQKKNGRIMPATNRGQIPKKEKPLRIFLNHIRTRESSLENWQIAALKKAGIPLSAEISKSKDEFWYRCLSKFKRLKVKHHEQVYKFIYRTDQSLYKWLIRQRREKLVLSKDKLRLLNEGGFDWGGSKSKPETQLKVAERKKKIVYNEDY